jgi:hypothetical protein
MFILSFIVMFGPKKGSVVSYRSAWSSLLLGQFFNLWDSSVERSEHRSFGLEFSDDYHEFLIEWRRRKTLPTYPFNDTSYIAWGYAVKNTMTWNEFGQRLYFWSTEEFVKSRAYNYETQVWMLTEALRGYAYKYHFTAITSRSTSYLLFIFWIFFFFFGEFLLLLVFNYVSLFDSITSHSFFLIKQHIIFLTDSLSLKLSNSINFYIYFLTTSSILYLINLNFILNYNFFKLGVVTYLVPTAIFIVWLVL